MKREIEKEIQRDRDGDIERKRYRESNDQKRGNKKGQRK